MVGSLKMNVNKKTEKGGNPEEHKPEQNCRQSLDLVGFSVAEQSFDLCLFFIIISLRICKIAYSIV